MRRTPLLVSVLSVALFCLPLAAQARVITHKSEVPVSRRTLRSNVYGQSAWRLHVRKPQTREVMGTLAVLPALGVQFSYPNDWTIDNNSMTEGTITLAVTLMAPAEKRLSGIVQNMNLVIEDISRSPLTLNQYTDESIAREREFFPSFTLRLRDLKQIAGREAAVIQFDATYSGNNLRYEQAWLIRGTQAFVWTFADNAQDFDKHVGTFRAILASFNVDAAR